MATATAVPSETALVIPSCEIYINNMFNLTFIPLIKHKYFRIVPILINPILVAGILSLLYYPSYYKFYPIIYSIDQSIALVVYDYLLYLQNDWATASCFEHTKIKRFDENVSLGFYMLFMLYWLYDGIIQFSNHNDNDVLIQFGNILMSFVWYIYFSISSFLYYFICIKLEQRAQSIETWLKTLKQNPSNIEDFYKGYKVHRKAIKNFSRNWNFIIFMGFVILTYHIPIDLINVFHNRVYTDAAGIVIKSSGLAWYTYKICYLNLYDKKVISYLYKHRLYSPDEISEIEKYAAYHELGLNFYGIKIEGSLIVKVALITINLILPTIYALLSNRIIG